MERAQMRGRPFATPFTAAIGLSDVVDPEIVRAYGQARTGGKHLADPRLP
jgi:hypothetical protein